MSLETIVAELVTATNALLATFSAKKSEINLAVSQAIAAIPLNNKKFYVNQVTGVDTAAGTADAPLKTIRQALLMTPYGGIVDVILQADYQLATLLDVDGRCLNLYSDTAGLKRKVKASYYLTANGTATFLAGFLMYNGGQVMASDIAFEFPSQVGLVPAPFGTRNSFFTSNTVGGTAVVIVKLSSCEVIAPQDWTGWILGASASAIIFEATGVVFPSNFAGRYINGCAAGTNPASLTNVLTNLPTL